MSETVTICMVAPKAAVEEDRVPPEVWRRLLDVGCAVCAEPCVVDPADVAGREGPAYVCAACCATCAKMVQEMVREATQQLLVGIVYAGHTEEVPFGAAGAVAPLRD